MNDSQRESFLYPEGSRFDSVALEIDPAGGRRIEMLRHAAGYPPDAAIAQSVERTAKTLAEFPEGAQVGLYLGPRSIEQRSFYEAGAISSASGRRLHLLTDSSFCAAELDCLVLNPHLIDCPADADPRDAIEFLAEHGRVLVVGNTSTWFIGKSTFATIDPSELGDSLEHTKSIGAGKTGAVETLASRYAA